MGQRGEEIAGSSVAEPVSRASRVKALTRNTQEVQANTLYFGTKGRWLNIKQVKA